MHVIVHVHVHVHVRMKGWWHIFTCIHSVYVHVPAGTPTCACTCTCTYMCMLTKSNVNLVSVINLWANSKTKNNFLNFKCG